MAQRMAKAQGSSRQYVSYPLASSYCASSAVNCRAASVFRNRQTPFVEMHVVRLLAPLPAQWDYSSRLGYPIGALPAARFSLGHLLCLSALDGTPLLGNRYYFRAYSSSGPGDGNPGDG